jgi:ABC-type antimicrobial peptide transport system permease subunit
MERRNFLRLSLATVSGVAGCLQRGQRHRDQAAGYVDEQVRSSHDVQAAGTVSDLDPTVPVTDLRTMEEQAQNDVYRERLVATLSTSFAGLATLLAAIGLYGVLAHNVAQRGRELGLRHALGAKPARLCALVLKQVGLMATMGMGIGVVAAVGLGRMAEALLFGLSGYDPVVLVAALSVLSAVVLAASYVPARRASTAAPMDALRCQ